METAWVQSLLDALAKGADPKKIIPDEFVIIRGGTKDMPPPGEGFCGAMGRTIQEAGAGVPHNQIRVTTAGKIRARGGSVELTPEVNPETRRLNPLHVDVTEFGSTSFSELIPNPTPKDDRNR